MPLANPEAEKKGSIFYLLFEFRLLGLILSSIFLRTPIRFIWF
uniref:Uncharacterized protein n=1 Tax=Rhizophora mucronata TaxID=61149 RepID=A0A2P2PC80_RHIMU